MGTQTVQPAFGSHSSSHWCSPGQVMVSRALSSWNARQSSCFLSEVVEGLRFKFAETSSPEATEAKVFNNFTPPRLAIISDTCSVPSRRLSFSKVPRLIGSRLDFKFCVRATICWICWSTARIWTTSIWITTSIWSQSRHWLPRSERSLVSAMRSICVARSFAWQSWLSMHTSSIVWTMSMLINWQMVFSTSLHMLVNWLECIATNTNWCGKFLTQI